MFGLKAFLTALSRLTATINRSADLFDAANQHLEKQLALDHADNLPALPDARDTANGSGNGRHAKAKAARA